MIRNNIALRTRSKELVEFFYPTYTVLHEYTPFVTGGVIYDGDSSYLQQFRDNNVKYIYIKGTPEFDLTIPENLLNLYMISGKRNHLNTWWNTLHHLTKLQMS